MGRLVEQWPDVATPASDRSSSNPVPAQCSSAVAVPVRSSAHGNWPALAVEHLAATGDCADDARRLSPNGWEKVPDRFWGDYPLPPAPYAASLSQRRVMPECDAGCRTGGDSLGRAVAQITPDSAQPLSNLPASPALGGGPILRAKLTPTTPAVLRSHIHRRRGDALPVRQVDHEHPGTVAAGPLPTDRGVPPFFETSCGAAPQPMCFLSPSTYPRRIPVPLAVGPSVLPRHPRQGDGCQTSSRVARTPCAPIPCTLWTDIDRLRPIMPVDAPSSARHTQRRAPVRVSGPGTRQRPRTCHPPADTGRMTP